MDRYPRTSGRSAGQASPPFDPAALAAGAFAVALAPAAVALLRAFPALLPGEHGVGWLLPAAGLAAAAGVAVGMLLCLERGLRNAARVDLVRSVALGVLAVGLAVASLHATAPTDRAAFPDGGLAATALGASVLLLAAQVLGAARHGAVQRSALVWLVLFAAVEAGLAAALLLQPAGEAWPWLLGVAAAIVAASIVPGPWLAAGLLAAGLGALAAARLGSVDVIPGLLAVAVGAVAYAHRRPAMAAAASRAGDAPAAPPSMERDPEAGARMTDVEEDALRLARELRGTIEELLHARRTIELQREEISQSAAVDSLTGIGTRRAVLDRLRIEAAEARRYQHPFAMVLLDLDGFARLNHERGMRIGDVVLREVALRLRLRVRAADALGRVGADSFLVILPHTDEAGAATFADALRRLLIARPIETDEGELGIAVSIGIAFMRSGMSLTDEQLLASADEALASARAAGGNRIAFDRAHGLVRLEGRRADRGSA